MAVILCPFRIVKPSSESLSLTKSVHLQCETARQCIIDAQGGSHAIVSAPPSANVQLTGFVFQGATSSAIQVLGSSSVTIRNCDLRSNNATQKGGALLITSSEAKVVVQGTRFVNNAAPIGAAIFHRGLQLSIQGQTVFRSNVASANSILYIESDSNSRQARVDLDASTTRFVNNSPGPATKGGIVSMTRVGDVIVRSSTNNTLGGGSTTQSGCYGLFVRNKQRCYSFTEVPFDMGHLTLQEHGIWLSRGLSIEVLARSGRPVTLTSPQASAKKSTLPFHLLPDGAVALPTPDGGLYYVSNSENPNKGKGGVYRLHLDGQGRPVEYRQLLSNTTRNCNGGLTPWNTFVSCEEVPRGQCWQVDPTGARKPQMTVLGEQAGGLFEAVAVDDRDPNSLSFFLSEDAKDGAIRRYNPAPNTTFGWKMLHDTNGTMQYLRLVPNSLTFTWTNDISVGRTSASNHFKSVEGIVCRHGILYFVSKEQKELFALDLDLGTYTVTSTWTSLLPGGGKFESQPDQIYINAPDGYEYFTEDGGKSPGIYVSDGTTYKALVEAYDVAYNQSETTGIEFAPSGQYLLFNIQENGLLFQARRLDGLPFHSQRRVSKWKYGLRRT